MVDPEVFGIIMGSTPSKAGCTLLDILGKVSNDKQYLINNPDILLLYNRIKKDNSYAMGMLRRTIEEGAPESKQLAEEIVSAMGVYLLSEEIDKFLPPHLKTGDYHD